MRGLCSRADLGAPYWLALVILLAPARAAARAAEPPEGQARSLVTVRTLVIDALGTRTVDTDVAQIPFGGTGLLIKMVPYAGPPLSFRLAVTAGAPQEAGIPLTLAAEIWSGAASPTPPPSQVSRREEATIVSAEGSYLFEIDHDETADRRIVLSLSVRSADARDLPLPPSVRPTGGVRLHIEVARESAGSVEPADAQTLNTIMGLPVSYSSGMKVSGRRPGAESRFVGIMITLTPERSQGNLVTVKVEISGADYVDEAHTRLEPLTLTESRTVSLGTRFEVTVGTQAESGSTPAGPRPVTYRVAVTPSLTSP